MTQIHSDQSTASLSHKQINEKRVYRATRADKAEVLKTLAESFCEDKLTLWFAGKGQSGFERRYNVLIEFIFEECFQYGEIYYTENYEGVALWRDGRTKGFSWWRVWMHIKFALIFGYRLSNRLLEVTDKLQNHYPKNGNYKYLWMIGVKEKSRGKGSFSALVGGVLDDAVENNLPLYLETTDLKNVAIYRGKGFHLLEYVEWPNMDFKIFMMSKS